MRLLLDESVPKRLRQHLPVQDVKTVPVPAYVPKAPDAIMAERWAFKRQTNAAADYDIRKLLKRIVRETQAKNVICSQLT